MKVPDEPTSSRTDLRMPLLGAASWAGALAAHVVGAGGTIVIALAVGTAALVAWTTRRSAVPPATLLTLAGCVLVAGAVASGALLRAEAVGDNPLAHLAGERAVVTVAGTVVSDPRTVPGRFDDVTLVRLEVREVTGRGVTHRLATPVLVIG